MPIDIYLYINLIMKLRITENQYKRIFLSEQTDNLEKFSKMGNELKSTKEVLNDPKNDAGWKSYQKYVNKEQEKIDAEEFKRRMKKLQDEQPKDAMATTCQKYRMENLDNDDAFNDCYRDTALKILVQIESEKQRLQSPWHMGSGAGCYHMGVGNHKGNRAPIKFNQFDCEDIRKAKKSAYHRLGAKEKKIVDAFQIPAYVYTSLANFDPNSGSGAFKGYTRNSASYQIDNGIYFGAFANCYYESDSLSTIQQNIKKYGDIIKSHGGTINCQPGDRNTIVFNATPRGTGWLDKSLYAIGDFVVECAQDYHCVLDVASIAALAIPGAGIFIAGALDAINAGTYFYEAATDPNMTKTQRIFHVGAGILTSFGSFAPLKAANKVMKSGSNSAQYAIKEYVTLQSELALKNAGKQEYKTAWKETIGKLTDPEDIKTVQKFFDHLSEAAPMIQKEIDEVISFSKAKRVELENFMKLKPAKFDKFLKAANGNLLKAFKTFRNTTAGRQALIQFGLFGSLNAILPPIFAKTKEEYDELVKDGTIARLTGGKYGNIKNQIEVRGWDWKETKRLFGSDSSEKDNQMLIDAVTIGGWEPVDPKTGLAMPVPQKYWTEKYKDRMAKQMKEKEIQYKLKTDKEEQDEDTMYFDSQEEIDQVEKSSAERLEKEKTEGDSGGEMLQVYMKNYNIEL